MWTVPLLLLYVAAGAWLVATDSLAALLVSIGLLLAMPVVGYFARS